MLRIKKQTVMTLQRAELGLMLRRMRMSLFRMRHRRLIFLNGPRHGQDG